MLKGTHVYKNCWELIDLGHWSFVTISGTTSIICTYKSNVMVFKRNHDGNHPYLRIEIVDQEKTNVFFRLKIGRERLFYILSTTVYSDWITHFAGMVTARWTSASEQRNSPNNGVRNGISNSSSVRERPLSSGPTASATVWARKVRAPTTNCSWCFGTRWDRTASGKSPSWICSPTRSRPRRSRARPITGACAWTAWTCRPTTRRLGSSNYSGSLRNGTPSGTRKKRRGRLERPTTHVIALHVNNKYYHCYCYLIFACTVNCDDIVGRRL